MPRDVHYSHLQQEILYEMGKAVKEEVLSKVTNKKELYLYLAYVILAVVLHHAVGKNV